MRPTRPQLIYVLTNLGQLFISQDGGDSWRKTAGGISHKHYQFTGEMAMQKLFKLFKFINGRKINKDP